MTRKFLSFAVIMLLAVVSFTACKNKSKDSTTNTTGNSDTAASTSQSTPATATGTTIKAKFQDFQLGDITHATFVDESGKEWDFNDLEDSTFKFHVELPEGEANETNQGFGPNKELIGKWFNITYVTKQQPQGEGGPMVDMKVITKVTAAE
jgi:hypothetical protein